MLALLVIVCFACASLGLEGSNIEYYVKAFQFSHSEQEPLKECEYFRSCASCNAWTGSKLACGWCASENNCQSGNMLGPLGEKNCSSWDFGFCSGLQSPPFLDSTPHDNRGAMLNLHCMLPMRARPILWLVW